MRFKAGKRNASFRLCAGTHEPNYFCALAHAARVESFRAPRTQSDARGGSDRFVCGSEQTFIGKTVTIRARERRAFLTARGRDVLVACPAGATPAGLFTLFAEIGHA